MTVAATLSRTRTERRLSIRSAARALGCTEMTYRMWERGVWTPGAERARAIAAWTGLTVEEVLELLDVLDPRAARERAPAYGTPSADDARADALAGLRAWFADVPADVDIVQELIDERRLAAQRESMP